MARLSAALVLLVCVFAVVRVLIHSAPPPERATEPALRGDGPPPAPEPQEAIEAPRSRDPVPAATAEEAGSDAPAEPEQLQEEDVLDLLGPGVRRMLADEPGREEAVRRFLGRLGYVPEPGIADRIALVLTETHEEKNRATKDHMREYRGRLEDARKDGGLDRLGAKHASIRDRRRAQLEALIDWARAPVELRDDL